MRLAKAGYMGGDPRRVREAPVDLVLEIMHYENFLADYQRTWIEMNRKEDK